MERKKEKKYNIKFLTRTIFDTKKSFKLNKTTKKNTLKITIPIIQKKCLYFSYRSYVLHYFALNFSYCSIVSFRLHFLLAYIFIFDFDIFSFFS
jgi:hypothetical protein